MDKKNNETFLIDIRYNNKTIRKNFYDIYNIYKNNTTIKDLYKDIFLQNNLDNFLTIDNTLKFYCVCNGKLINPYTNIFELFETLGILGTLECIEENEHIYYLEFFDSLSGGEADITDIISMIFKPIFDPIIGIGKVFIFLFQFIVWLGKFIYWFILFLVWLFTDLLNPVKLISDFWNSIILIIVTIISTIINIFIGLAAFVTNIIGGWLQGFWGWDQSNLTKNDKLSNYFKGINRAKGKKCYLTNNNTVPFSIILGTILCPPLGVFMDMGLTGWFNIFVCTLLTLLFYLPGLFYALIIIYS